MLAGNVSFKNKMWGGDEAKVIFALLDCSKVKLSWSRLFHNDIVLKFYQTNL